MSEPTLMFRAGKDTYPAVPDFTGFRLGGITYRMVQIGEAELERLMKTENDRKGWAIHAFPLAYVIRGGEMVVYPTPSIDLEMVTE